MCLSLELGPKGGDCDEIIRIFNDLAMINVGRAIAYSENPAEQAKKYQLEFNDSRENTHVLAKYLV